MTTGRVDISHTITYNARWLNAMKVRDVIKIIESDGWYRYDERGVIRQYKHPTKTGRVTFRRSSQPRFGSRNIRQHIKTGETN